MSATASRSPAPERWRLLSLTLRNFRAIEEELTFRFDRLSALIHGPNGAGKSTIAQGLQWTLYGKFPLGVLANRFYEGFLAPVTTSSKNYSGQVVLIRGKEQANLLRDEENKRFCLTVGGMTYEGKAAELKRDELFGLPMDTFVRAVVLQQSRIRGLLLDDPKERNKALDSLLGTDRAEELLLAINPKDPAKAARTCRQRVQQEQLQYATRLALLQDQREVAQARAGQLGFFAQDFNPTGLRRAYAELAAKSSELARRANVKLSPLPDCSSVNLAREFSRSYLSFWQTLRRQSTRHQQLAQHEARFERLTLLSKQWAMDQARRDHARQQVQQLVQTHGTLDVQATKLRELSTQQAAGQAELKHSGALRQLLLDAHAEVVRSVATACPVCQQPLPPGQSLSSILLERAHTLANATITQQESRLGQLQELQRQSTLGQQELEEATRQLQEAQRTLEERQGQVTQALGGERSAEAQLARELPLALEQAEQQCRQLRQGVNELDKELERLELQERNLREGLLPVLEKREEQSDLEQRWRKAQQVYQRDEQRANELDWLASQLEQVRSALLNAKNELATQYLTEARPRASALYQELIHHPIFDTLEISTKLSKQKIDYSFQVSIGGQSATAREARLVLSDGQLTATAVGLFFALAESAQHHLDLLYLDDPSQNLDRAGKQAMARVIAELALRRQVIISTHDADLVDHLEAVGFGRQCAILHLRGGQRSPQVESTFPINHAQLLVEAEGQLSLFGEPCPSRES
jgi:DNA repair exonuclease SbcCD ATPase subunit